MINDWTDHLLATSASGTTSPVAGQHHDIRLDYDGRGGGAVMHMRWSRPGAATYVPIPFASPP